MKLECAQGSDSEALAAMYHRNHHLSSGRIRLAPEHDGHTVVLRSDSRIIGLAMVSYLSDGVHRYGVLHVLEVDDPQADYAHDAAGAMMRACRRWLKEEHGTDELLAAPQLQAWIITEGLDYVHALEHLERRMFPPRESEPIQVPRQVWA